MSASRISVDLLDGQAWRPPLPVRMLNAASRAVIVALVCAAAVGVLVANRVRDTMAAPAVAPVTSPQVATATSSGGPLLAASHGRTISAVIADLDRAAVAVGADILELRIENPRGSRADVTLRIDVPGSGASAIARLLAGIEAGGIADGRVDSVAAVPGGSRLTIVGRVLPSTDPVRSALSERRHDDVSVELAELTAELGVELRGVETSGVRPTGAVKVRAVGTLDEVAGLIGRLEADMSAPPRIRALRLDRTSSDTHVLDVTFLLRERPSFTLPTAIRP